ncbi:MAG: hypothetical protein FJY83_03015 [Candidatus Aminicenantes bacterium]|nr:hypothetical protein [Candidatus Aminicenantes bacterium]
MSRFLHVLENEVQIAALVFLASVYLLRVVWLMRFRSRRMRTYPRGSAAGGVALSLVNISLPWSMESVRRKPFFYVQFVVFHLGVAAAIAATFIIPYAPAFFRLRPAVLAFQVILTAAFLVGLLRLYRRLADPALRLVSSADDIFSLVLMTAYFAAAFLAVPNDHLRREWTLILFFGLTAFFLVYVPFSKIGHYLYYPFTRFFLGRTLGHRGVRPAPRSEK